MKSPKAEERPDERSGPGPATSANGYDLRFVWLEQNRTGGWYRELPDASIEVMSHGHLQRVPLGEADPEQRAREVIQEIVTKHQN